MDLIDKDINDNGKAEWRTREIGHSAPEMSACVGAAGNDERLWCEVVVN